MATTVEPIGSRFADAFWDEQHNGVDAISQRLVNATQTCEEIKKLYEIRSQMEGDYGDRLLKLSQLIVGQDEDGTLAESLSHIPSALETTARAHMDLAQQLLHHLQSPLDIFIKEQSELYTAKQRRIQETVKAKGKSHERMIQAKSAYVSECDKLKEIYRYLEECIASADEQAQAGADRESCLKNVNAMEQDYRQSIDDYNDVIMNWIDEWRATCDIYQQLEEKRIRFVRSSLWAFANMMSSVYIVDDQCCERIRTALELTDVDKDIYSFVENHGTGKALPGFIEFEDAMPHMPPPPVHPINAAQRPDSDNQQQQPDSIEIKALPTVPAITKHNTDEESPQQNIVPAPSVTSTSQHSTAQSPTDHQLVQQLDTRSLNSQHPRQSEAMAFAAQAIENMIQDDVDKNQEIPVTLSEHKLAPQELPAAQSSPPSEQLHNVDESKPPAAPQPATMQSLKDDTNRPSSVTSRESNQARLKPVPNPAFSRNKDINSTPEPSTVPAALDTKKQPTSDDSDNDRQLAELISTAVLVAAGTHSETKEDDGNDKKRTDTNKKDIDQNIHDNDNKKKGSDSILISDDESEDSYKYPVRPPPKDEKWVISSIRRPQMVPVRSTNARVYDGTATPRGSIIRASVMDVNTEQRQQQQQQQQNTSTPSLTAGATTAPDATTTADDQHSPQQQEPSPEANVSGKMNRPHPPLKIDIPNKNSIKAAAQEAIAAGRANTQHHSHTPQQSQQQPQQQPQQHMPNDTIGIRPPPWQQEGLSTGQQQQQQQPTYKQYGSPNYNQRFSQQPSQQNQQPQQSQQQTGGGLHRYGSVSGPRVAPDAITSGVDNGYGGRHNNKNGKDFGKFMKGVLKSGEHRPLSSDVSGGMGKPIPTSAMELNTPPPSTKKEKGGRFSLGIFGNKKDKDKRHQKENRDSILQGQPHQQTPPANVLISGPPGGGPITTSRYHGNHNKGNGDIVSSPSLPSGANPATQPALDSNSIPSATSYPPQKQYHHRQQANSLSASTLQTQSQQQQPSSQQQQQQPLAQSNASLDKNHLSDGTPVMHYARAVWSFTASIPMEMSFSAGDRVAVVKKQADGWWDAELQGPKKTRGLVPGNYM
ncbi:hypothetical protein BCR42DRAFT_343187, partial [Absidia repens]